MLRAGRHFFIAAAIALMALSLTVPSSAPALGISGFNLARTDPGKTDSSFHFNLKPGESIEKELILKNTTSDTVQDLKMYAADALPTNNGGIALRGRFEPKKALAKWIRINSPEEITLGPGEERRMSFRLNVPYVSENYEKIGSIVVEGAVRQPQQDGQFILKVLPRVALLIYQRLPGPAITRLKIVSFSRDWVERNIKVELALKNIGNISVQPRGRIDIYDMFGRKADVIPLENMKTIFPKKISRTASVWQDTPAIGYFTAEATVLYGKNKSEQARMEFLVFPWWVLALLPALWIIARQQRKRRAAKKLKKLEAEKADQAAAAVAMDTLAEALEEIEEADGPAAAPKATAGAPARSRTKKTAEAKAQTKSDKPMTGKTIKKPATRKSAKPAAEKPPAKKSPKPATAQPVKPPTKKSSTKKTKPSSE